MKKQKAKKQTYRFSRHTAGIMFAILLVAGCFVSQVAYNKIIWQSVTYQSNAGLRNMIVDAIRGISQEAVTDGPSRKVYLPEANLVLPPYPKGVQGLRYGYSPQLDEENLDAELRITTNETLDNSISAIPSSNQVEDIFAGVPKAQACSRQIIITFRDYFGQPGDDNSKVCAVNLADGRTAYLYLDSACKDNSEPLIRYLQQLQSY